MSLVVDPLTRVAKRFDMKGHKVILMYIAIIVTLTLALAIYSEAKTR